MKVSTPILKSIFLNSGKGIFLLGLAGCAQTLTNVTPKLAQRNPSNLYRFTTQCNLSESKVIPGTFKPILVIDGKEFPLVRDELTPSFYYYDHVLDANRTDAKYYFQLTYQQNNRGKVRSYIKKTELESFKISERCCFSLDNERAPVGSEVRVLGRGFNEGDRIVLGECEAQTSFLSDNVIAFQIPNVIPGKTYPVYSICNNEKNFVGNLLVDCNHFTVTPDRIELMKGEKIDFTVACNKPVNEDLYVNVTTDIPNSVIMPEVKIPSGSDQVTVTIEGGDAGEGHLYVSAQGFEEVTTSIRVQEDLSLSDSDTDSTTTE